MTQRIFPKYELLTDELFIEIPCKYISFITQTLKSVTHNTMNSCNVKQFFMFMFPGSEKEKEETVSSQANVIYL